MVKRIISAEDVTLPEALKLLEEAISKYGPDERSSNVLDYLRKYSKVDPSTARELVDELVKRFGLARITAIQIVNIMPKHVEELKSIIGLEKRELTSEELQEIINLLGKSRK